MSVKTITSFQAFIEWQDYLEVWLNQIENNTVMHQVADDMDSDIMEVAGSLAEELWDGETGPIDMEDPVVKVLFAFGYLRLTPVEFEDIGTTLCIIPTIHMRLSGDDLTETLEEAESPSNMLH